MNNLIKLIKSIGDVEPHFSITTIIKSVRTCLIDGQKEMRANAFRFLRHFVINDRVIKAIFKECNVDIFIVRTMTRDHRYDVEREQALRLIRSCIDVPQGCNYIPQSVVRVLIALSEQPDEKMRPICIETLCEYAVRFPKTFSICGGFKVLVGCLLDGPKEVHDCIVFCMLSVLDLEDSRCFIRPSVELEMIMSCFTDAYGRITGHEDRLSACSKAIVFMLKTWSGLIFLCSNNKQALRSLVNSIRLQHEETRKVILEMFYEIFLIEMPKWYPDFISSRHRIINNQSIEEANNHTNVQNIYVSKSRKINLVNQHQSILLAAFIDVGIVEALVETIQNGSKYIATRSTILIGELRELSNDLLPASFNVKINSLSTLFETASSFQDESKRHAATLALIHIDSLQTNKERFLLQASDDPIAKRWLARTRSLKPETTPVIETDVKTRIGTQIDDNHYKHLVNETEAV